MTEDKNKALSLLRQALDNPEANFRDGQWEAIAALVSDREQLLVVQRTGWGKSIVYFLATKLLRDRGFGPTIIISPLLSLMRNQIEAAKRMQIEAVAIDHTTGKELLPFIQQLLLTGQIDVLLISPERLANDRFREEILSPISDNIGLFVVDEAHCISDWGHDFRPDYRRIVRVLQALPRNLPALATTATANDRVVEDIVAQLGPNLRLIRGPLTRQSLRLQNISIPNPAARMAWLAEQLPKLPGSGIIYTLTVKDAERVAGWLQSRNISAEAYHSQLESEERIALEDRLLSNEIKALVATTALGMGFDKPDLGFVIHYQRPSSVVHYYQQVGRAGRAVETAYGILLSGGEDEEITNYFINNAFPPERHTEEVLKALNRADEGLSVPQLEQELNLANGQINKVLKLLSLESPPPVVKQGSKWSATAINYQPNTEKIEQLKQIRYREQEEMRAYMESQECLMFFLAKALDDENPTRCGKCTVCVGEPLLPESYSGIMLEKAKRYLRRTNPVIEPRKQWKAKALPQYGFSGNIKEDLRAEEGRALCLWGDPGWGELVKRGKYETNRFDDRLIEAAVSTIQRWQPQPNPTWITCVPSLNRSELVPDLARRLAARLKMPFEPVVVKVRQNQPQKTMSNSYQQAHNLDGVFEINGDRLRKEPVFLIDDFVDSRWTFTVIAALLRKAGSGQVFPLALALNSLD